MTNKQQLEKDRKEYNDMYRELDAKRKPDEVVNITTCREGYFKHMRFFDQQEYPNIKIHME